MSERKSRGYWQNVDILLKEVKMAMKKEGWTTLPPAGTLEERGYSRIANAIQRYHGGFYNFRTFLGEEQIHVKSGTWKDIYYCMEQALVIMEKENWKTLPGQARLIEKGYSSLSVAITKYHGGCHQFRKALGEKQKKLPNGIWKNLDYTVEKVRETMENEGWELLPTQHELQEKGYPNLAHAIGRYHGGFHKFRELLGEEQKRVEKGTWQNLDYTIQQARMVMRKESWETLPSQNTIYKKGYSSLGLAITKYHGGFPAFRELLLKSVGRPTEKEQLEGLLKRYVDE